MRCPNRHVPGWSCGRRVHANTMQNVSNLQLPLNVEVIQRGISGRVLDLKITGRNQFSVVLKLDNIRRTLSQLPSTLFFVDKHKENVWQFYGGGFGHGVGMSQSGAIDLADKGWNAKQILMRYYPGSKYGFLP